MSESSPMENLSFFCTSLRMSSVRVEPNVIDYIVCPSFSLTYYYRPVCAITNTNEKHLKSA